MIAEMVRRHRSFGVIVDTNILLLLVVGSFRRDLVGRHKRTITFVPEDLDLLVAFLNHFEIWLTTPNILTEVSNLAAQVADPDRTKLMAFLARSMKLLNERHLTSAETAARDAFPRIGLTDSGIIELAEEGFLVLTDDFTLAQFLQTAGMDVLNFNHLRTFGWE